MIPKSNTPQAALFIETVMREREYPCSPAAAARAGYEAARRAISAQKIQAELVLDDEQILSCIPLSSIGKPMVWLTQKDVVLAIKNAINVLNTEELARCKMQHE